MIRNLLNLLICSAYLSGCVRYYIEDKKIQEFNALQNLPRDSAQSWDHYCDRVGYQHHPERYYNPLPRAYTEYAKCLERGYDGTPADPEQALKMYRIAAQCDESEAIGALRLRSEVPPQFAGCTPGEFYFPCLADQTCGLTMYITPAGYILSAPITIPVGVVLAAGAILTLPICVLLAPGHKGRCM